MAEDAPSKQNLPVNPIRPISACSMSGSDSLPFHQGTKVPRCG